MKKINRNRKRKREGERERGVLLRCSLLEMLLMVVLMSLE